MKLEEAKESVTGEERRPVQKWRRKSCPGREREKKEKVNRNLEEYREEKSEL